MKPTLVSILTTIVLFVGTLQPSVAAMYTPISYPHTAVRKEAIVFITPKEKARTMAKSEMRKMYPKTWKKQWSALAKLWGKESAWNHRADNPHSSAYGIAQVLKTPHGSTIEYQVSMGLKYIEHRYGTPARAWKFHQRHNYY